MLLLTALSLLLLSGTASAQATTSGSSTFHWEAGVGVVCSVEATACPDVATASNGDTVSVRARAT